MVEVNTTKMMNKSVRKLCVLILVIILQLLFINTLYRFVFPIRQIELIDTDESLLINNDHQKILSQMVDLDPTGDKCSFYFEKLAELNDGFTTIDLGLLNHKYATTLDSSNHKFFLGLQDAIKQEYQKLNKDTKEIDTKKILNDVNKQIEINLAIRTQLMTSVGSLRIYDQCVGSFHNDQCMEIDSKLFPWFTFESPIFQRWDGTRLAKYPKINLDKGVVKVELVGQPDLTSCFWSNFNKNLYGQGVVIPVASLRDLDNLTRLIKVLRQIGNQLPLQIVYNKKIFDIDPTTIDRLISNARDKVIYHENGITLKGYKQEIWFVDVSGLISEGYDYIVKDSLPIILTIFNSFEKALLISPETVPVSDLKILFEQPGFIETGMFQFQSRDTNIKLPENYFKLLQSIFPSTMESSIFPHRSNDIPTNKYINPKLIYSLTAPDIVLIDKKNFTKVSGLLTTLILHMTSDIHANELYWLGQLLHNEKFSHNSISAGAIGELGYNHIEQPTVSSTQMAHFIDNQLIFVTDGLFQCEDESLLDHEFEILSKDSNRPSQLNNIQNKDELHKKYRELIKLNNAVIPPLTSKLNGWEQTEYCHGNFYKASNNVVITDEDQEELKMSGKFIRFNQELKGNYQRIIDVWSGNYDLNKLE